MKRKLQVTLVIGVLGGLMAGIPFAIFDYVLGVELLHPAGGLITIAALFIPAFVAGFFADTINMRV